MGLTSKKRALCFLVLQIMLAAQVIMAQHATVHFMENAPLNLNHGQNHHQEQHNHGKADHTCSLCFLAKGLQNILGASAQLASAPVLKFNLTPVLFQDVQYAVAAGPYLARGPPASLS